MRIKPKKFRHRSMRFRRAFLRQRKLNNLRAFIATPWGFTFNGVAF